MTGGALIPLARLRPHPGNIRKDLGDLAELATSIKSRGLLQPLVVTQSSGGRFMILDGHRRFEAAKLAGVTAVPCLAVKPGDGERDTSLMLAAAMHKALEPLEQAAAFKALRRRGLSVAEIARKTGYSVSTVSGRLFLADLPDEAQDMVADKTLTVTQGTQLGREVRRRASGSTTVRTPKVTWLNGEHRLAQMVRNSCGHSDTRARVGGVGCGQCWEDAIRFDERDRATARAHGTAVTR